MTMRNWDKIENPERKVIGWKFGGLSENQEGVRAVFYYSVELRQQDGTYAESHAAASDIVRPCRYDFTLAALETIKKERSFITSVSEKLVDEGISAFIQQGNVLELKRA